MEFSPLLLFQFALQCSQSSSFITPFAKFRDGYEICTPLVLG